MSSCLDTFTDAQMANALVRRCSLCRDPMDTNSRNANHAHHRWHVFYVRELNPEHPGLNPNHSPQWRVAKKLTRKKQTTPRHGIAEASPTVVRPVLTPAPGGWVGARFSWAHRQPTTHIWFPLECAAHGRSRSVGPAVFLGSPPTRSTHKPVTTYRERHMRHNDLDTKMPTNQQFITVGDF